MSRRRSAFYPRCRALLTAVLDGRGSKDDPSKGKSAPIVLDPVNPKSCKVTRNGYHDADTFDLEFDARTLPFDPEIIASVWVRIYMWDSEGDESREWQLDRYLMLSGLADNVKYKAGNSQLITMPGRDFTSVLDGEWDPRKMVPSGLPLDQIVQHIADAAAPQNTDARFTVKWMVFEDDGVTPVEPALTGATARSTKKKGMWVKQGKTVWEVIYELVLNHGYIVYIREQSIIIANPRTASASSLALAPRVTYGKDLMTLEADRKLAKEKVPQIKIVYFDAKLRDRFSVIYPENHNTIVTGLGVKKNEVMSIPAPRYCHTRDSALRYAKMRWDLMARAEAEYKFTTRHMRVLRGDLFTQDFLQGVPDFESEFDLLKLQAGDPVGIAFDPFNGEQLRALEFGERVEYIKWMGYKPRIAEFISANLDRIDQFKQPYYCKQAEYDWSSDDGLKIEITGVNYASEARELGYADGTISDPPGYDSNDGNGISVFGSPGASDVIL